MEDKYVFYMAISNDMGKRALITPKEILDWALHHKIELEKVKPVEDRPTRYIYNNLEFDILECIMDNLTVEESNKIIKEEEDEEF